MFVPSTEAVKITIDLLEKYKDEDVTEDLLNSNRCYLSPEDFLQEYFAQDNHPTELQDEVSEFFFRIYKYLKYFKMIMMEFFESKVSWAKTNPNEISPVYFVLLYFLIIELNEFTKNKIEKILMSLYKKKTLSLLTFLKRPDSLTKLYECGCRIWDVDYVKSVLENIIRNSLFEELYDSFSTHTEKIKQSTKKELTVPVGPKCLTRPKKFVAVPQTYVCHPPLTRIPISIKANRTPSTTYVQPVEIEKLQEAREKRQENAKKLFDEAQKKAFRCANLEKSEKFKETVEKINKERCEIPIKKNSYRKIISRNVKCPKKTAAVILREGARLVKLEQEEIKRYEDLANGGFNSDLIVQWEEELRERNYLKRIEDIEKKHLEGLLSYEEALLAKQKCLKNKKEKADEFRKEKEVWSKQLEIWKNEEQMRLQETVEKGKALEKNVKEAVEQAKEEKHKIALETMEESKTLKERWLKEREQDLQRKVQIIKEIKALQALGMIRRKETDFSETANLGFLCEMSIAELKERLFILRVELQEELEKRREEIRMRRECRKDIVQTYEELIDSHQQIAKEQRERTKERAGMEKMNKEKMKAITRTSSSIENLRRILFEKRRERLKQQIMI